MKYFSVVIAFSQVISHINFLYIASKYFNFNLIEIILCVLHSTQILQVVFFFLVHIQFYHCEFSFWASNLKDPKLGVKIFQF